MRFDVNSSGPRPTTDTDKSAGVGRAAAIYAKKQLQGLPGAAGQNQSAPEHRPHVSPMGQLMRDLHGLKSNDPNAFAKVTASIANRLHEIAANEPDESADRLNRLADRFAQASQTGNLMALRPTAHLPTRALHGAAAYAQAHQEERSEIRHEVRSAIDEVLSEYLTDVVDPGSNDPQALDLPGLDPHAGAPKDGAPTGLKVLVSA